MNILKKYIFPFLIISLIMTLSPGTVFAKTYKKVLNKNNVGIGFEKYSKSKYRIAIEFPEYISIRKLKAYFDVKPKIKFRAYKLSNTVYLEGDFKLHQKGGYDVIVKKGFRVYGYEYLKKNIYFNVPAELKTLTAEQIQVLPISSRNNELGLQLIFPKRIISDDIRNKIEILPKVDYAYNMDWEILNIYGDFKPQTDYVIRIKKGFETVSHKARHDIALSVKTGDLKPNLRFTDNKKYVSSETEAVNIEVVNVDNITVTVVKVNESNLNYLTIFSPGYFQDRWRIGSLVKFGKKVAEFNIVPPAKKNEVLTIPVDLKNNLKSNSDGIYMIEVRNNTGLKDRKVLFKSDIGIASKVSKNQMFFMLRSLSKNEPIKDAEIKVYDKTNKLIFTMKSNNEGIAVKDFTNVALESPALAVVKNGKDINFLMYDDSVSKYNILRDYNLSDTLAYDAFMFFERSLIRPGESVNMLIAVKGNDFKALANKTVILKVFDPLRKLLLKKSIKLNESGVAEFKFDTYESFKTGVYDFKTYLGKSEIGSHKLNIQTFLPEKIKIDIKTDKRIYKSQYKIDVEIKSKYLFGSPAAKLKCFTELVITEDAAYFKGFEGYSFYNKKKDRKNVYIEQSKNSVLNNEGVAKVAFNYKINNPAAPVLKAKVLATVYDDGRPVRKYKTAVIYPFDNIIGIKKSSDYINEIGKPIKFDLIDIDPKTSKKIQSDKEVKITVYKEIWHYYAGIEMRKVSDFKSKVNSVFEFIPNESGAFKLVAENDNGQKASVSFYVSGWDFSPFDVKDKSAYKIKISTDKDVYKENEQLHFDVKSPISGVLLITLESGKVDKYYIYEMKNNTFSGEITLPENLSKGFYLKAMVIRSTDTGNKILPFRAIGGKYIKTDKSEHKIDVEIISKDKAHSFDKLNILIKAKNAENSYAVVSAVDFGILNIINEGPVDAFGYFMRQFPDRVSLYDIYSDLLAILRLKTETPSGGAFEAVSRMAKHLAPVSFNNRVKSFSFWSKIIKLDENGEARTVINIPSYKGKILVQAVVVNSDSIGSTSKAVTVKDDIMVKPVLPRFFVDGDVVNVPLRVFNTTDRDKKVELEFEASKNLSVGLSDNTELNISAKSSEILEVPVFVKGKGESRIKFIVKNEEGKEFVSETFIPVMSKFDTKYIVRNGVITHEKIKLDFGNINIPKDTVAHIYLSESPYLPLQKSVKYLIGYPYGCAEQTASKILAMLHSDIMLDNADENTKKLLSKKDENIKAGIAKLISMQNYRGFFSYWQGGYSVNHYASTFATSVLIDAKNAGYYVPDYVIEKSLKADENYYNSGKSSNPYIYLSINDDIKVANFIYDEKGFEDKLSNYIALAAVMKRHGNTESFNDLMSLAKIFLKNNKAYEDRTYDEDFYSYVKDVAFSLYVYLEQINKGKVDDFAKKLLDIINRYVQEDRLYSTQDRAYVLRALYSYYGKNISSSDKMNVTVTADGKKFDVKKEFYKRLNVKTADFEIDNKGKTVSYSVELALPVELPIKDKTDGKEMLTVKREFYDKDGNKITSFNNFKTGQKIIMKISATAKDNIKNIVINSQIPAAFEIMNPNLYKVNLARFKNKNVKSIYTDFRDDRVLIFVDLLKNKTMEYYVPLIVGFKGDFVMPATYIEAMYDSRINSYYKEVKKISVK